MEFIDGGRPVANSCFAIMSRGNVLSSILHTMDFMLLSRAVLEIYFWLWFVYSCSSSTSVPVKRRRGLERGIG